MYISPLAPRNIVLRSLRFTFIGPNAELYIPNQRQLNKDFKDSVNFNIWGQIPIQF